MASRPLHDPDPARIAEPLSAPSGDPLGEVLHLLKLTGAFYCQSRLTAPWGVQAPVFQGLMPFFVVTRGHCWLTLGEGDPLLVEQGGLVLLPGAVAHALRSDPEAPAERLEALPVRKITEIYETLDHGGGGRVTEVMYGLVRIDHAAGGFLMDLLPDLLKVDAWGEDADAWLRETVRFIAREARALRPGGQTVITRLADVLVIEAIRNWIATAPEADKGWLKGVRDRQIGQAVLAIHRAPQRDWTVERLARAAGMSRSAFSARFSGLIGMSAMRYVARWRMLLARERLTRTPQSVATIAADLGYLSEPSFCRAFKRVFGEAPGEARRRAASGV